MKNEYPILNSVVVDVSNLTTSSLTQFTQNNEKSNKQ